MTTDQNGEEKGGQSVPISQRVTDTLYALTQSSGVLSVRTIAEATGNSRSSTHRILQALADSQYAEQREDGGYTVGRRLVELAARVFGVVPGLKIVDDIMTALVAQVGETSYLATYNEGETFATFVHRVESNHSVRHVQALGTRLPLHAGAVGKAILSAADIDLDSLDLTKFTPQTPTTVAALKKDVESARQLGYATSFEERVVGVDGVAAPLFSGDTVVGGLTVAIPTSRAPEGGFEAIGDIVRERAHELSSALTAMGVKHI
ncbi:IclR family transcriptional regulator [Kribbella steppae]|uniref:IclR family transcriptional regulator n=1 Tax=Kribbella steppae TaxID=2512223 RepID=A0A4R2H2V4_9ACTN|nr:IclR family transcriptional regulator [Kribbella steppae]TCO19608.1 IclR family transcriptional regulator [Kribbella steppae]